MENRTINSQKKQNILYVGTHLKVRSFGFLFLFFLFSFFIYIYIIPSPQKKLEKNWNGVRASVSKVQKMVPAVIRTQPGLSALPVHSVVSFQRQHVVRITGFTLTRCSLLSSVRLLPTTWRSGCCTAAGTALCEKAGSSKTGRCLPATA